MNKHLTISLIVAMAVLSVCGVPNSMLCGASVPQDLNQPSSNPPRHIIQVEMGPYDLRKDYRIMEGPYAVATFRIEKALDKTIKVPESQVHFVEDEKVSQLQPSRKQKVQRLSTNPTTSFSQFLFIHWLNLQISKLFNIPIKKTYPVTDLYWFTGARVDVLDESGRILPEPIYLCHGRLDLLSPSRKRLFPNITYGSNGRLCLFTQGSNVIMLPAHYGVPVAGREKICVNLKALKITTHKPKRIRLRCTIYLVKDKELNQPMSALNWQVAHVLVLIKQSQKYQHECCLSETSESKSSLFCISRGKDAPNNTTHWLEKNKYGDLLNGHWVVPPSIHTYSASIDGSSCPNFASNGPIRAAWAHVHPFCKSLSLVEVLGDKRRNIFTIHCRTKVNSGARLTHIEFINTPQGISLNKNARYFLTATYNNTSGKPQDSMAITGIFFSDLRFKKPLWARVGQRA